MKKLLLSLIVVSILILPGATAYAAPPDPHNIYRGAARPGCNNPVMVLVRSQVSSGTEELVFSELMSSGWTAEVLIHAEWISIEDLVVLKGGYTFIKVVAESTGVVSRYTIIRDDFDSGWRIYVYPEH